MEKDVTQSIVPENFNNYRLDKYLSIRFNYLSRTQWQKEISEGRVLLNGKEQKVFHKKIQTGDTLIYMSRAIEEPEVDSAFSVLYEDEYIIGINKSGNIPVHPSGRFRNNTLLMVLENKFNMKLNPIHRLDRETSGVILFAKNKYTASLLQKNFDKVSKTYIAIVHGYFDKINYIVDVPIGKDKNSVVRKKRAAYTGADEKAKTVVTKLYSFNNYSLVKAKPITGRLHQIRVHLNYLKHPLVGDKIYGLDDRMYLEFIENGTNNKILETLGFHRSALHARSIRFFHPEIKRTIKIKAPTPVDFIDFIERTK